MEEKEIRNLLDEITSKTAEISRMCEGEFEPEECHILCNEMQGCVGTLYDSLEDDDEDIYDNPQQAARHDRCRWHRIEDVQPYNNDFFYLLRLKTHRIVVGKKIKKGKYVTGFGNSDISDQVEMWANLPTLPKD